MDGAATREQESEEKEGSGHIFCLASHPLESHVCHWYHNGRGAAKKGRAVPVPPGGSTVPP